MHTTLAVVGTGQGVAACAGAQTVMTEMKGRVKATRWRRRDNDDGDVACD